LLQQLRGFWHHFSNPNQTSFFFDQLIFQRQVETAAKLGSGLARERHRRQVYLLCYRFAGNHEDASDLAQDVFVRAFRGLKTFKGQSSLATWLYRIGVNTSLNKAAVRRPVTEPIEPDRHVDMGAADPLEDIVRGENAAQMRAAIRQLPPKQRATLILRVYHELPHEEIARALGSSVGAVKANFFHALGNLRRLVKP